MILQYDYNNYTGCEMMIYDDMITLRAEIFAHRNFHEHKLSRIWKIHSEFFRKGPFTKVYERESFERCHSRKFMSVNILENRAIRESLWTRNNFHM